MKGLSWVANSCYIDVVLIACIVTIDGVDTYLRTPASSSKTNRIRSALINIYNYIIEADLDNVSLTEDEREYMRGASRDIHSRGISTLRERLRACSHGRQFASHDENDAGEFTSYLFNLLKITNCSMSKTTYFSNDRTNWYIGTRSIDSKSIPIVDVVPEALPNDNSPIRIDKFLSIKTMDKLDRPYKGENGVHYEYKLDHMKLNHADFVVFNIIRLGYDGNLNRTPVFPVQHIQNLTLRAVVVYDKHHYTAYVYVNDVWYYYDDLHPEFVHVGKFEKLLNSTPSPMSAGTLYWYG
jgi:ubiquitin C-terminal hydrolase